jgi:hypothetical protein
VIAALPAACATHIEPAETLAVAATPSAAACRDLYTNVDALVAGAGVGDAQSARIVGYPYLRVDRFLAADDIKPGVEDENFEAWVERLRDLDTQARHVELRNLPGTIRNTLDESVEARLATCAALLIDADLDSADDRAQLTEAAQVFDDYSVAKRIFGLYPFTSLVFNAGVSDYHESTRAEFSRSLQTLPVAGALTRYQPPPGERMSADSVSRLLRSAAGEPPGTMDLSPTDRRRLFESFAPVYEIDIVDEDDRIGVPAWNADGYPTVDVGRPVVFRRISFTRFEGQTLLQLNYSVWFRARPSEGDFDLLSGRLDGITFRVTLGRDGRPLVYDSMHNCGCYHLFVPTTRLRQKPLADVHEEPPLVPQRIELEEGRVVLRIAHRTHYLQRVYFDRSPPAGEAYSMLDDDTLRSLPTADGERRSLFEPDGLVRGTERGERWFFWPMGISAPGAMRQWGHHATLFVGRRHFDDADIIERYFHSADEQN